MSITAHVHGCRTMHVMYLAWPRTTRRQAPSQVAHNRASQSAAPVTSWATSEVKQPQVMRCVCPWGGAMLDA